MGGVGASTKLSSTKRSVFVVHWQVPMSVPPLPCPWAADMSPIPAATCPAIAPTTATTHQGRGRLRTARGVSTRAVVITGTGWPRAVGRTALFLAVSAACVALSASSAATAVDLKAERDRDGDLVPDKCVHCRGSAWLGIWGLEPGGEGVGGGGGGTVGRVVGLGLGGSCCPL